MVGICTYMAVASSEDTWLLPLENRTLKLKQGQAGWFGQTPWWIPNENSPPDVRLFLKSVDELINLRAESQEINSLPSNRSSSGAAASTPYTRYVRSFEIQVSPAHSNLQKQFVDYLEKAGAYIQEDIDNIDVQFKLPRINSVLGEVKPCDMSNCRYAIRTAMGQLLDYRQRSKGTHKLLVIVSVNPTLENIELATSNGFGIAYPRANSFEIIWPQ